VPEMISCYARDGWYTAPDKGTVILDASTGEPVARASSTGADFRGMVEHARSVGGPALRELTFHQRGSLLKALAAALTEHRPEFYESSATAGSTLQDAQFDVDGGIQVLGFYASKARRELPNATVYLDGLPEKLGKAGTSVGQHIYTSRLGVAVFIDAFNFPVWGMLEKLAPALVAGVPAIVKPATPTAHVAAAVFRRMIDAKVLPDGAVQFLSGGIGDLFDHLTGQDSISFTGSADTARLVRCHPAIVREAVRFNAEADSLNCSILGPDATPGTTEFDLYIGEVVREMVQKTGQKCTAIRRALVPSAHVDAVIEELSRRLAEVRVGDPREADTTMGPLASRAQLEDVRAAVARLSTGADVVYGGLDRVKVSSGDVDRGAFMAPTVLRARSPEWIGLHTIEAFGPVTSVIPYQDVDHAIDLAARGRGSLVASVVTHDPEFARRVVLGIAPYHGRCLVLDRDNAKGSSGHGAAPARLVHGGPGRAGGGEELGGIRAVLHHMQITGVHSSPAMLTALSGRWMPGAPTTTDETHPFRKYLEDLSVGQTLTTGTRTVTLEDIERFANLTGDLFYAHMNEEAAKANPLFGGRVAHGYFVLSASAGLFVDPDPGPVLANFGLDRLRFVKPVYPGDTLRVFFTCKEISAKDEDAYGEVRWDVSVENQNNETVATYEILTLVAKRPAA
jgi:oxepin-CoA hydrolase/3-oxo-5,6-dehydrosuberyl-CoA semialdehyde dehydrogenase